VKNIEYLVTSDDHKLAIKNDGTVWGIGSNTEGQLGLGDTKDRNEWTQTSLTNVQQLVA
jgi:alpha-tubulin suppressor-like RCC1 family protein